jgi:hypothetical protein
MDLDNCAFVHHDPSQTKISCPRTYGPPSSFSSPWKETRRWCRLLISSDENNMERGYVVGAVRGGPWRAQEAPCCFYLMRSIMVNTAE